MFRSSFSFCTLTVPNLTCWLLFLVPFRALGLLSTLCTAFYALVGMLLRGGKTVEKREFLPDFNFYIQIFCTIRLFLIFTYLFSCRCRSDDVYVDFSLDLVCSRRYGTRFSRMFWKIAVWTQSATDDPEFVSPSTGHQILHQWRVILLVNWLGYRECVEGSWSSRTSLCVCEWGNVLASGERGFEEKTLNPLMLSQSGWMAFITILNN